MLGDLEGAVDTANTTAVDIVVAVAVAIATVAIAWLVGRATRRYLSRPETSSLQLAALGARAVRWAIYFIGGAWSLSFLGASANWFALTLALVGVLVVLIARPMLEKFAAGVALTTRPAFSVGDDVAIGDFTGAVLDITSRSTVLRLRDGRRVHIPNTEVVGETIVIYTTEQKRRSSVDLEIEASHSVAEVEKVLLAALAGTEAVSSDPPPRVRARGFGNAVSLSVRFWHESTLGAEGEAIDQAVRAMSVALRDADMSLASASLAVDLRGGASTKPDPPR